MACVAVLTRQPLKFTGFGLGQKLGCSKTSLKWIQTFNNDGRNVLRNALQSRQILRNVHKDYKLVYEGPLSNTVKYIKTFSLATCVASLVGTPILIAYGKKSVSMAGKIAVGATVLLMGMSTTFILHWFTRVYVHRMFYNPLKSSFAVETMNIVARRRTTYFPVEHIQYPLADRAFSTFSAQGKNYFLHMELKEAELAMGYIKEKNLKEMMKRK